MFDFNARYDLHEASFAWCFLSQFAHFNSICEQIWFDSHISHLWLCVLYIFAQNWHFANALHVFVVCSNFWHLLHCVSNFVLTNSTVLQFMPAIIMFFSIALFDSFFDESEILIDESFLLIRFSCFVNHIDSRINLIEFYCSISFYSNCISFEVLNASIWMSCTIASCHFLSTLISSNSKRFSYVFRYSINFWAFEFSVVVKTMCCSMRKSCNVYTSTSTFLCNFSASLILFRYSIAFIVEIWFFDFAIMRLLNYASDFADFAKFFSSCILALLVIFRDTTYAHEVENAFFDAFWSLCNLETIEVRLELKSFDLFWTIGVIVVFVRNWIKFIIWFNFDPTVNEFFSFFHRWSFRYASRCSVTLLFRDCASRSRYAAFAPFAHFAQRLQFASQRRRLVVVHGWIWIQIHGISALI